MRSSIILTLCIVPHVHLRWFDNDVTVCIEHVTILLSLHKYNYVENLYLQRLFYYIYTIFHVKNYGAMITGNSLAEVQTPST